MLKITTQTGATGTIFELEGKIAGPWVQELGGCWQRIVTQNQPIKVVLKAVTFIDSEGRKLLAEMHRQEAELAAEEFMMKAIIEEIIRGEDL
jgi:ABC-type transporter Mla MlaB component